MDFLQQLHSREAKLGEPEVVPGSTAKMIAEAVGRMTDSPPMKPNVVASAARKPSGLSEDKHQNKGAKAEDLALATKPFSVSCAPLAKLAEPDNSMETSKVSYSLITPKVFMIAKSGEDNTSHLLDDCLEDSPIETQALKPLPSNNDLWASVPNHADTILNQSHGESVEHDLLLDFHGDGENIPTSSTMSVPISKKVQQSTSFVSNLDDLSGLEFVHEPEPESTEPKLTEPESRAPEWKPGDSSSSQATQTISDVEKSLTDPEIMEKVAAAAKQFTEAYKTLSSLPPEVSALLCQTLAEAHSQTPGLQALVPRTGSDGNFNRNVILAMDRRFAKVGSVLVVGFALAKATFESDLINACPFTLSP
ncbi:hypothetical protein N7470_002851 [Penicillium chermesinum]|nr:hypothetical protein N7470_002851 [Penicillium chermesinum]